MANELDNAIFKDADKAREFLEQARWPNGPVCPHCGALENIHRLEGKASRPGLFQCNACHGQFSVTVGTVFERSKIALNVWLLATHLLSSSKKGMSSHQLHRMLGVTYKTAWFMTHRIREAMKGGSFMAPMGGAGKTVEAGETYHGQKKVKRTMTTSGRRPFTKSGKMGVANKRAIVALVERGATVRTFHVTDHPTADEVGEIVRRNVDPASKLYTDESRLYPTVGAEMAGHETVKHSAGEYCSPRRTYKHHRKLLLDLQARDEWRVPALQRGAPAPLPERIRVPL
jgi:transposase-like protein